MKQENSSIESYRNSIAPTMNKALPPGAFQHFCDARKATFDPTRITGAYLASSSMLIHVLLKEAGAQGLRKQLKPENYLFGYQQSCFRLSKADPAPHQTPLGPTLSSTEVPFCCSCSARCLGLLAESLGGWTLA